MSNRLKDSVQSTPIEVMIPEVEGQREDSEFQVSQFSSIKNAPMTTSQVVDSEEQVTKKEAEDQLPVRQSPNDLPNNSLEKEHQFVKAKTFDCSDLTVPQSGDKQAVTSQLDDKWFSTQVALNESCRMRMTAFSDNRPSADLKETEKRLTYSGALEQTVKKDAFIKSIFKGLSDVKKKSVGRKAVNRS